MPLKLSLIALLVFLASSACKDGPIVTVCLSDPSRGVMDCWNQSTQTASTIPYANTDKWVAFNPADAKALLDYCSQELASGTR